MRSQNEGSGNNETIYINMLGFFSITTGEYGIRDSDMRTHQLWHLIQYLIAFRHKTISQEELIEALWPAGDIDNPSNALKNLVYRIRSTFASHNIPHAKEMIIYNRGSYHWNNALNCVIDTEQFEGHYNQASDEGRTDSYRIEQYLKAIDLYAGDFLPSSGYESWVVPLSTYYHSLYFKCVYAVLDLLSVQDRYEEIEMICKKALIIDQFDETTHRYLMTAMLHQGKQALALAHYSFVTDLFFREMGVSPSEAMRSLYRDIVKKVHSVEVDIGIIQDDLREEDESEGAFYCEYEVFKSLYRLEARTAARTGQSIFICLLTVTSDQEGGELELKVQTKVMDGLYEVIQGSLRKGDVFARFSASQYVLMLPTLTYENCQMVMTRVIRRYRQTYRTKGIAIHAKMQPLDPVDMVK